MNLFSRDDFIFNVKSVLRTDYAVSLKFAKKYEIYNAVSKVIMKYIGQYWESDTEKRSTRQAYYLSSEYLMGRALGNNLMNLQIYDDVKKSLEEINIDLNEIERIESDAGLGNGGLGRLAACFLDSAATHRYPLHGYGIRYEYGLFKQAFVNGKQYEQADNWLKYGDPWSIRRASEKIIVTYADQKVYAIPYDTPVIGYKSTVINTLRLWKSEPIEEFNFALFNDQDYDAAMYEKNRAEDISRVLYPNDSRRPGKILRLKQQYFFVSASIQDLINKHLLKYNRLDNFSTCNALQLNDTHPAVAIAEFVRILTEEHDYDFGLALREAKKTFSYTNHTILSEALEKWDIDLYREILPNIVQIIEKINQSLIDDLHAMQYSDEKIARMSIIGDNQIRMAHLAIYGSKFVNGVAELHTQILKDRELRDWYELYPHKFLNKTNGITQRRWLNQSNPELTEYLSNLLGSDAFIKNLDEIGALESHLNEDDVLLDFLDIKKLKKEQLAAYIKEKEDIEINPNSLFDIQIKRLHEYKRQLLNAFQILDYYYSLKENRIDNPVPRTYIFGAKSAPGYEMAKGIIQFILALSKKINTDLQTKDLLQVVFVTNYNVSYAQYLFPAANVSEQISTAGKEASGTGNMKFMLNGAPTLGTLDGANVEIVELAGEQNNIIFGLHVDQIDEMRSHYNPREYYETVPGLKRVVDSLVDGTFQDGGNGIFKRLYDDLLNRDEYFVLADFDSYRSAQRKVDGLYRNKLLWAKMSLENIAHSSKFSSDRTIQEYCEQIWFIHPID